MCCSREWLAFLVCGKIATACLLFGASDEFERRVSAGFKVGVPLTQALNSDISENKSQTKPYTIGPVVNVSVVHGVSFEFSALYKRIDQQATATTVVGHVDIGDEGCCAILEHHRVATVGKSWEFPIAAQYHFAARSIRPYVEGGISYNQLRNIFGYPSSNTGFAVGSTFEPTHNVIGRRGFLFGTGASITHHIVHVTPGIRFTRYNRGHTQWMLATNVVDFLVDFKF